MKVAILGGGIVGLWTADVLLERGHEVVICVAGSVANSTSASAVAVITPLFPGEQHEQSFQRSVAWYHQTLERFVSIHDGEFVEWIPAYEFGSTIDGKRYLEKDFHISKFDAVGLTPQYVEVDPPIAVENHLGQYYGITFGARFATPLCNSEIFLPWLASTLQKKGARFEEKAIQSLDEVRLLDANVYVNCLGFQSLKFFDDPRVRFVRGQSMFLPKFPNPAPHFGIAAGNHAIFKHRRGFYLGSYFLEGEVDPLPFPSRTEYELSHRFAEHTYPQLCAVAGYDVPTLVMDDVARVNSGIRPFRRGGPRIEAEVACGLPFVHNYGHGAHGWTIGYGTAVEAADLVDAFESWSEA